MEYLKCFHIFSLTCFAILLSFLDRLFIFIKTIGDLFSLWYKFHLSYIWHFLSLCMSSLFSHLFWISVPKRVHFIYVVLYVIAAVKRYFTSKKEGATRKARNKDVAHKQRQATYERKKEVISHKDCKLQHIIQCSDGCLMFVLRNYQNSLHTWYFKNTMYYEIGSKLSFKPKFEGVFFYRSYDGGKWLLKRRPIGTKTRGPKWKAF